MMITLPAGGPSGWIQQLDSVDATGAGASAFHGPYLTFGQATSVPENTWFLAVTSTGHTIQAQLLRAVTSPPEARAWLRSITGDTLTGTLAQAGAWIFSSHDDWTANLRHQIGQILTGPPGSARFVQCTRCRALVRPGPSCGNCGTASPARAPVNRTLTITLTAGETTAIAAAVTSVTEAIDGNGDLIHAATHLAGLTRTHILRHQSERTSHE